MRVRTLKEKFDDACRLAWVRALGFFRNQRGGINNLIWVGVVGTAVVIAGGLLVGALKPKVQAVVNEINNVNTAW